MPVEITRSFAVVFSLFNTSFLHLDALRTRRLYRIRKAATRHPNPEERRSIYRIQRCSISWLLDFLNVIPEK